MMISDLGFRTSDRERVAPFRLQASDWAILIILLGCIAGIVSFLASAKLPAKGANGGSESVVFSYQIGPDGKPRVRFESDAGGGEGEDRDFEEPGPSGVTP